jgi:xanthine dehydrogenase YagS FAD-binding subunit
MQYFKYIDAKNIEEASSALKQYAGKADVIAGGTDLVGSLARDIKRPEYPEALIDIKSVPGLSGIKEEGGMLKIGALTKLADIAENSVVLSKYKALAQAAEAVASPQIRNSGTIAGNICQGTRCWYYRCEENKFDCLKKNQQGLCYALIGDDRYHSIFGATNGCVCVNPSDVAPALVAFGASVVTNKRTIPIGDFFDVVVAPKKSAMTVLEEGEIVTEIQVPEPASSTKSHFVKVAIRKAIDFPIVNCAAVIGGGKASICLNAVAGKPRKVTASEEAIAGKEINEENAEAAASVATKGSAAITHNKYKIQLAKALVKKAILACK